MYTLSRALVMRLVQFDSDRVVFSGRRPARGPLIIGIAFFVIAAAPFVTVDQLTPLLFVTSFVAAALGSAFVRAGWPQRTRIEIRPQERTISIDNKKKNIPDSWTLALSAAEEEDVPRYEAHLVLSEGERVVVLQGESPDEVLRQVGVVSAHLAVAVKPGWGLPRDATPWASSGSISVLSPRSKDAASTVCVVSPVPSRRDTGFTVLGFGMGVAALMVFEIRGRLAHGDQPRLLDLVLPTLTATAVFVVGAAVLSRKVRVRLSVDSLDVEPGIFGISRRAFLIPRKSIHGVFAVGPPGKPRHVLFDTEAGPLAIRCGDREASEVAAIISRAL